MDLNRYVSVPSLKTKFHRKFNMVNSIFNHVKFFSFWAPKKIGMLNLPKMEFNIG